MARCLLGIDLGGTKALGCVIDPDARVVATATRETGKATTPAHALAVVTELVDALRAETREDFVAVGVGFPGIADTPRGVARSTVMMDGWREVPFASMVAEATGLRCVLDNDVNAAALAEVELRARDDGALTAPESTVIMAAVGTGIGGAVLVGGRVLRGAAGAAGEIGHVTIDRNGTACWCGRRGCLNTFAAGRAIEERLGLPPASLVERVARGDARAVEAVEDAARWLGVGIANAAHLLNPRLVVIGGGFARLGDAWLAAVERSARSETFPETLEGCRFELARGGYEAGAIGAALLSRGLA